MEDRPEFAAYVSARSPKLVRIAYLLCHDWQQAEDLLQTALAKAWLAWRRISGDPDPYVYRVLVNTHTSWWRRSWRAERPTPDLPEVVDSGPGTDSVDDRSALWAALGQLPRRQRAVVVLRYFADLSEVTVADILGCSPGTVKSQASRALAKLRVDPELEVMHEERS